MSKFHYPSLSSHLTLSRAETTNHYETVFKERSKYRGASNRERLFNAMRHIGIHEHETFHCRSTLSTSYGRLLFYISQIMKTYKIEIIESLREPPPSGTLDIERLHEDGQQSYLKLFCINSLWLALNNPSAFRLAPLIKIMRATNSDMLYPADFGEDLLYLRGMRVPTANELEISSQAPPLSFILESLATWKEYSYLSKHAAYHFGVGRNEFFEYTDAFCNNSIKTPAYRAVGDLFHSGTGQSMNTSILGYILDIALCPPITEACEWVQLHPGSRLLKIISVWPELKMPEWSTYPNYISLPQNAYEVLDNLIAYKLGWSTAKDNIKMLADSISHQMHATNNIANPNLSDISRSFLDHRFHLSFASKLIDGGIFIDPKGDKEIVESVGYFSQPLITSWEDGVDLAEHILPNQDIRYHFLVDALIHLFVDDCINSSMKPPNGFKLARKFHGQALGWALINGKGSSLLCNTLEEFASNLLGYRWSHKG